MSGFIDVYLPLAIRGFPFVSSPRFSTTITAVANASEHRNRNWLNPLHRFNGPEVVRCHDTIEDLKDHWMVTAGPFLSFPFRDPMDFASRRLTKANLEPTIFATDQVLGSGDDLARDFQLKKTYTRGAFSYARKITLPIVDTVLVALNALDPATADPVLPGGPYTWSIDRETGILTFDHAPTDGVVVTAGFLFDVQARFEADDSFDAIVQSFETSGAADLTFVEVRPCSGSVES